MILNFSLSVLYNLLKRYHLNFKPVGGIYCTVHIKARDIEKLQLKKTVNILDRC